MTKTTRLVWIAALLLLTPSLALAEKAIAPHDPLAHERLLKTVRPSIDGLFKIDSPSDNLILPLYEVDTTDPGGSTTLFAVRNTLDVSQDVVVGYTTRGLDSQSQENITLGPGETFARNLRDVAGLATDSDGFKRGIVLVVGLGDQPALTGDFFSVDVGGAFATGDRLVPIQDFCDVAETRFADFGSGTDLTIMVNSPLGSDSNVDPPTFTVEVLDEAGNSLRIWDVFVSSAVTQWEASDFALDDRFGTLVFDFSDGGGGWAYAGYSNSGLFSVGFGSACIIPGGLAL